MANLERLLYVLDAARALREDGHVILASPDALEAWEMLGDALARYDRNETEITVTCKPCQYCKVPIFFAQLPNERWVPIETETVQCKGMIPQWRYTVTFDSEPPKVLIRPQQADGEVWVNHMNTCGAGQGPKHRVPQLIRRWRANQEMVSEVNDDFRDQLLAMRAGLQHGDEGADTPG